MDIRKILDIVTEAEKPLAKGMKVMSLAQFLQQSGVEAPEGEQETVNELSPKTKKSYSIAAKLDKKFNDNSIDKAKRMSKEQPHKQAEWDDEVEFLKSVNAKRDRGLKRAGVAEGSVTPIRSYLVMASRPGRGMYTDVDVLIKDTGTGKIVGHVTGRGAHPNMDNEMDIAHYEITLNKDGIGPDLKNGFEFEAYGDPHVRTKRGYQVYATDNSGKNRPKQKPKPRSDVGQKVVQLRPEQPKKPQGLSVFSQGNLEKAAQTAKDDDRDYGPGMELVSNVDWYAFLEKFFGKELLDVDSANEMGYTDWTDNGDIAFTSGEGSVTKKVDEAEKLGGVSARKLPPEEMRAYLDRITKKEKEKTDKYKLPYIHSSNIPIVNDDGQKYDLQKLAAAFSERPTKILKQNEKMQHSDGTSSQFYNVGLPALKGLAIDEDTGEFVVIDTCPGAGSCKLVCYAMKGGYVQWKASSLGQTKLLNFLYNDPDGFMGMLESEIAGYEAKNKKKNIKTIIRWHDAGDFFSPQYLAKAFALAKKFPDVDFYAYTKLAGVAQGEKPDNFKINFSAGAQPSQEKKIDFQKTKNSRIVPKELFSDALEKDKSGKWQYTSPQAQQAVKDRMAIKYSLDPKSVITYDEMMKIPVDKSPDAKGKYNVIVKPGDGDDAANRNDVLSSLLLIH